MERGMLVEAEIQGREGWRRISIADALEVARRLIIRCPVCHQRLSVHKARADGTSRAHFVHWPGSGGCAVGADADADGVVGGQARSIGGAD